MVVSVAVIMIAVFSMNVFACLSLLLLHHAHSLLLHRLFLDVLNEFGNSHPGLFSILSNPPLNLGNLLRRGTLARHWHGNAALRRTVGRRRC